MSFADASTSVGADYPTWPDASIGTGGDCLADYSPRDATWDARKVQADRIAALYAEEVEFRALGQRVHRCAGQLVFAWVASRDTGELAFRLHSAEFCRVRHCPVCQWRRSMMWQAKFYQALPAIQEAFPRHRWVFLTLTVRNCRVTELRATLAAMSSAWGRLVKRPEFKPVIGWIRTTEVTRGRDDSAHPHFHCLLLVKPSYFGASYISQARWVEIWESCARLDYVPMVDVRAVKGELSEAVQETLKYSVKPSDMEAGSDWFTEMTRQVHKLRFIATGGILKDILKPEAEITNRDMVMADNPGGDDDGQAPRLRFAWDRPVRKYRKTKGDVIG